MSKVKLGILTVLGLVALLSGQPVQAGVISYSSTAPSNVLLTGGSSNIALHQFDSSIGTLVSVEITGSVKIVGQATGFLFAPPFGFNTVSATELFDLTISNSTLGINQVLPASVNISAQLFGNGGLSFSGLNTQAMTTILDTNASHFATYTGPGTFSLNFATSNLHVVNFASPGPTSPITYGGILNGGTVTVTYTYADPIAAVPEPSSMLTALGLAFGSAGFGLLRTRKRKLLASAL